MKELLNFSKEDLIKEIKNLRKKLKHNKFGLVWDKEREKEQVVLDCENNLPILNEIKEKEIKKDETKSTNILIEGDNYHTLTCLNYTHKEKIDVIYIDPPYNTGNNDFKYNDRFIDKEDNYRHSKWLNFMEKRLRLAKNLLKKSGVIFISIDDNEQANLKLLCDKIFGEKNFIANCIRKVGTSARMDAKFISKEQDYFLIYSFEINKLRINKEKVNNLDTYILEDEFMKERGKYKLNKLDRGSIGGEESMRYIIKSPNNEEIYPGNNKNKKDWRWRWSKKKFDWGVKNKFIIFKHIKNKWSVYFKQYQFVDNSLNKIERENPFKTLFLEGFNNEVATKEINEIFGERKFDYSKPTSLITHLLKISSKKNSIVLDFFAGSGTTGHAVLKLNEEDNGNRQFILCTNNENKICEEVCYQRIKKVINGYKNNKGDNITGLGGNLKYYKTDFVKVGSILDVNDKQRDELTQKAGFLIAIKEKCYDEIYFSKYYQLFKNDKDKYVAIYFREDLEEWLEMEKKIKDKKTRLYIFSFGNVDKKLYKYLGKNIKIDDIPEPILEVYKEINLTYGKGERF